MKKLIIVWLFFVAFCMVVQPVFANKDAPRQDSLSVIVPQEQHGLWNGVMGLVSDVTTLNNPVHLDNPKQSFSTTEQPSFSLSIPTAVKNRLGEISENVWKSKGESITAAVVAKNGTSYPVTIKKTAQGKFLLSVDTTSLPHGDLTLKIAVKETSFYTRDLSQDFSWGVLTINTDKSIYIRNETAHLYFGIVDQLGHTLCKAKIEASITAPSGQKTNLSTQNGTIQRSKDCAGDSYVNTPDYSASYQTTQSGVYQMVVIGTNDNGTHAISDYFVVRDSTPFSVDRSSFPSRIYPVAQYPVTIKITANQDYNGVVSDSIPQAIKVTDISNNGSATKSLADATSPPSDTIAKQDEQAYGHIANKSLELYQSSTATDSFLQKQPNVVVWNVNWKKGHTYTLSYTLNFPPKSPEFYLLGPFTIGNSATDETTIQETFANQTQTIEQKGDIPIQAQGITFQEIRQWQVAGDATKCWVSASAGNWSTAGSWSASGAPGSTDIATFDVAGVTCGTGTNSNSTIDASFAGTVAGVLIKSTYSGTITQAVALTVGSSNYSQAAGTFTGATQAITVTGTFTLSGGTFNSTSGILDIQGTYNTTGGTFVAGTGTVQFDVNSFTITPSTETYNNVTFNSTSSCVNPVFTLANATTITVNATLKFASDASCQNFVTVNGPGAISAKGDISLTSTINVSGTGIDIGVSGNALVTVNGTGTQTMTGITSGTSGQGSLPSITINKASGTFNVRQYVTATKNWTWTAGTVDYTGSTVDFDPVTDGAATVTPGATAFNNVTIDSSTSCTNPTLTLAAATTMTVTGTLTLAGTASCQNFTQITGTGGISAQGDIALTSTINSTGSTTPGTGIYGSALITVNGTGTQTMTGITGGTSGQGSLPSITINKASGTFNVRQYVSPTRNWTWTAGTVDYTGSTVDFDSITDGTASITPGATAFNNVTFDNSTGCTNSTPTLAGGSTLTVAGTLTFASISTCVNTVTVNGTGTITAQGNMTTTNSHILGSVLITLGGSGAQTVTQSSTNVFPAGNITINATGTITAATALSFNAAGQTLTVSGGTLDMAGFNLTVNSAYSQSAGTLKLQGAETITTGSTSLTGGTVNYYGTATYSSLKMGNTYYNLTISGTGTFTAAAVTTVNGTFTQSAGTFNAPTNINIGGNLTISAGTFTEGNNTITFIDNTQTSTFTGITTFYNLTSITAGKTINFPASTTITVNNSLTLRGNSSSNVLLRSTVGGTQWKLTIPSAGTLSASYLDIKDSNACSSANAPLTASSSLNSGNNSCWLFPGNSWYNSSWGFRLRITINHTKVTADQTNFPALISWTSNAGLSAHAQTSGNDILFTQSDGVTVLNYEIEKYVTGTGELEAWVQIPSLSSSVDTVIYMYYGNATASSLQNKNATWDSNYIMVQHLGETSGTTTNDSTSNANNGSKVSATSPNPTTSGQIDGAQSFNGTSDSITVTNTAAMQFTSAQSYTISGWVNVPSLPGAWATIIEVSRGSAPWYGLWINPSNNWAFGGGSGGAANIAGSAASTGWHYLVGVQQGSVTRTLYVDGTSNATGSVQNANGVGNMQIGRDSVGEFLNGTIDEVRLSNTNRSASWIQTEYNNQSSPSTFITLFPVTQPPSVQIHGGTKITGGTKLKAL